MDFNFSDEEQDFRRAVRDWVSAKYPKAKVNELERHEDHDGSNFPYAFFDDLASAGFLGVGIDESLGGQGGGATMQAILMDELARNLAGLTWVWGISSFCAKSIRSSPAPRSARSSSRPWSRVRRRWRSRSPNPGAGPICSGR